MNSLWVNQGSFMIEVMLESTLEEKQESIMRRWDCGGNCLPSPVCGWLCKLLCCWLLALPRVGLQSNNFNQCWNDSDVIGGTPLWDRAQQLLWDVSSEVCVSPQILAQLGSPGGQGESGAERVVGRVVEREGEEEEGRMGERKGREGESEEEEGKRGLERWLSG